jgi:hypothetical protein
VTWRADRLALPRGVHRTEVTTDDSLRQLFTTGNYAWSLTYLEPYFEIVGRPPVGLLVVYGAHPTIDGAIERASAHMDML